MQKELKLLASLAQKKNKEDAFGKKLMEEKVYMEAVKGNMEYFFGKNEQNQDSTRSTTIGSDSHDNDSKFQSQIAPDGSNVLHLAIQHKHVEFAKKVMECYPHLIWEKDYNGDTPLHTAAKLWCLKDSGLHDSYFKARWEEACGRYLANPSEEGLLIIPPWRVKNCQGNTPLHEVMKSARELMDFGECLLSFDLEVITYANGAGDTPLHLCEQQINLERQSKQCISLNN